jgi:hypothetical protein
LQDLILRAFPFPGQGSDGAVEEHNPRPGRQPAKVLTVFGISCRKRPRPFTNAMAMSDDGPRAQTAHICRFLSSFPNNCNEWDSLKNQG